MFHLQIRDFAVAAVLSLVLVACGDGKARDSGQSATRPEDTPVGSAEVIQPGPLEGYFFEASVKTVMQSNSTDFLVIKSWFDKPARSRWELMSSVDDTYKRILLIDGDEQWFYEPGTNTYTHGIDTGSAARLGGRPYPLNSNYQLGLLPIPSGSPVRSDTYLGRDLDIYQTATAQVKTEHWIDREYGVTLRQLVTSADPTLISFEAKVNRIQYNPRFSAQAFAFEPPSGSRDSGSSAAAQTGRATITPSRGPLNIPAGLLSPSYIPEGYNVESTTASASAGVTSYVERRLVNAAGEALSLKEQYRPGGLPDYLKGGTLVTVGPDEGYVTRGGGEITLLVYKKDVIVTVGATALPIGELRKMVESME
jgi:outer membrane lipoprotein-sorting protein